MKFKNRQEKHKLETAIEKLSKEEQKVEKQFDKYDNRTNVYLSISLGLFSLQITLLTNTIINIYEKYFIKHQTIVIVMLILFVVNILFNLSSILNFRKSSTISEDNYSNKKKIDEFVNDTLEENLMIKHEYFKFQRDIEENNIKIISKEKYINKGLNSIIISIGLIVPIVFILFIILNIR